MGKPPQQRLFDASCPDAILPVGHQPFAPAHLNVERIYLAKGSMSSQPRRRFVQSICDCFQDAEITECFDTPHNRIDLGQGDPLIRHSAGKRTLVLGQLENSVRFSEEDGSGCPNYWHFSPYGFCPYGCKYCYLAGTPGVWFSPTIKVYVNLAQIIEKIDRVANRLGGPTAFYLGKLQDGLALDTLTAFSTVLVPFFARHPYARQIMLTKSSEVGRLLSLDHGGNTILSWSVNPPDVAGSTEENVPSVDDRLLAMARCAERGYPVRAVMMPMIPVPNWQDVYADFIRQLLTAVPLERLTLGGICSYTNALGLMRRKMGSTNCIADYMEKRSKSDGRSRYSWDLRTRMYSHAIRVARQARGDLELALCLEQADVWQAVGLADRVGRCNCRP